VTRIFFGGCDERFYFHLATEYKVDAVLVSYWKMRERPDIIVQRKEANPDVDFMVDSGAYTFQKKGRELDTDDFKAYLDEYLSWLEKYQDYIWAAVELDVDEWVGLDQVMDWWPMFDQLRVPVIRVFHPDMGLDVWKTMCHRFPYVGITKGLNRDVVEDLITLARAYLTKVHGFGITDDWSMKKGIYYTTDSTTWKTTERWGCLYYWDDTEEKVKTLSRHRQDDWVQLKEDFEAEGLDWSKIAKREKAELSRTALIAYTRLQHWLDEQKTTTPYWDFRVPPGPLSDHDVNEWVKKFRWYAVKDPEQRRAYVEIIQALQSGRKLQEWDDSDVCSVVAWILQEEVIEEITPDVIMRMNAALLPRLRKRLLIPTIKEKEPETREVTMTTWDELED